MIGERQTVSSGTDWPSEVCIIDAASRSQLTEKVLALASALRAAPSLRIADVAFTLCRQREGLPVTLAVVAGSTAQLIDRLETAASRLDDPATSEIDDARGIYFTDAPLGGPGRVAFVFPGEGSQYVDMFSDAGAAFAPIRETFDVARTVRPMHDVFPGEDRAAREAAEISLRTNFESAIHALMAGNIAMYALAKELGLEPDALVGYSSGDYAAALAAGILTVHDLWSHVGSGMWDTYGGSAGAVGDQALLAARASVDSLESRLGDLASRVVVAMDNCPHSLVLSGSPGDIEEARIRLRESGVFATILPGQHAYHTSAFDAYAETLQIVMEGTTLRSPTVPTYSCTTAARYPSDPDEIRKLVLAHWRSPVRFRETIERMHDDGIRIFLEVGPNRMLTGFADDTLRTRPHLTLSMDRPGANGIDHLNHTLARLLIHGVGFNVEQLFAGREARTIDLVAAIPAAPQPLPQRTTVSEIGIPDSERDEAVAAFLTTMDRFLQTQQSIMETFLGTGMAVLDEDTVHEIPASSPARRFPLLGPLEIDLGVQSLESERAFTTKDTPVLKDHAFGSPAASDPELLPLPVIPMTFSIEMMAEAATALRPDLHVVSVRDVRCLTWLVVPDEGATVRVSAKVQESEPTAALVEVGVYPVKKDDGAGTPSGLPAARGIVVMAAEYPPAPPGEASVPSRVRESDLSVELLYDHLFHGPLLQAVTEIGVVGDDAITGAITVLPLEPILEGEAARDMVLDPGLLDAAQHLISGWSYECVSRTGVIFPSGVDEVSFYGPPPTPGTRLPTETLIQDLGDRLDFDVHLRDEAGRTVLSLRGLHSFRVIIEPERWERSRHPETLLFGDPWPAPLGGLAADGQDVIVSYDFTGAAGPRSLAEVVYYGFLSRAERSRFQTLSGPATRRVQWLLGRMMAKDAVRSHLRSVHGLWLMPADIELSPDEHGQLHAGGDWTAKVSPPAISLSHSGDFAVAIAGGVDGMEYRGIDVERIQPRPAGFDRATFTEGELAILHALPTESRDEWMTRLWCAKEAVGKALGRGMVDGPRSVVVRSADPDGRMRTRLCGTLALTFSGLAETDLAVVTGIRGEMAYAYTDCLPAT